jgi:hypothetical protein
MMMNYMLWLSVDSSCHSSNSTLADHAELLVYDQHTACKVDNVQIGCTQSR